MKNPTHYLLDYLSIGNVYLDEDTFGLEKENSNDVVGTAKTEAVNQMLNPNINYEQSNINVQPQNVNVEQTSQTNINSLNQSNIIPPLEPMENLEVL